MADQIMLNFKLSDKQNEYAILSKMGKHYVSRHKSLKKIKENRYNHFYVVSNYKRKQCCEFCRIFAIIEVIID